MFKKYFPENKFLRFSPETSQITPSKEFVGIKIIELLLEGNKHSSVLSSLEKLEESLVSENKKPRPKDQDKDHNKGKASSVFREGGGGFRKDTDTVLYLCFVSVLFKRNQIN